MRRESTPKQLEHWTRTLAELETFFKDYPLPTEPIRISQAETIVDARKFVAASLATARANFGVPTFAPYVSRLIEFKKLLIQQNQKAA
jgi:hypothetical protein